MASAPGVRLGPYEVLAAIGKGSMGEVYKARDTRRDRTVAIQSVRPLCVTTTLSEGWLTKSEGGTS